MKWQDQGIVLRAKRHGESSWILSLMTHDHGRHVGMMRVSAKNQIILQAGNLVQATWTARLPDHLGSWQLELISSPLARIMNNPLKLMALTALIQLLDQILAERHPYPLIYQALVVFINHIQREESIWLRDYIVFELMILEQLGYGLDLSKCAATGRTDDLVYVSPKSGCAVSREVGQPYHDRMLTLPAFLIQDVPMTQQDLIDALNLTAYFLSTHFFPEGLPESRGRLGQQIASSGAF